MSLVLERSPDLNFVGFKCVMMSAANETENDLHERLRPLVLGNIHGVDKETIILQPFVLTASVAEILGVKGAVAVASTNCCHEFLVREGRDSLQTPFPYNVFVGCAGERWMQFAGSNYRYTLGALEDPLTADQKNRIYDALRVIKK